MSDESWRTPNFRQSVVNKINEAIVQSGMVSSKNSQEMESHVFQKSQTKDEYLSYVARLILHVREMNKTKNSPNQGQDGNNPQQMQQQQQQRQQLQGQQQQQQGPPQGGGMMQDPINALQNLASQGTRMPQPGQGQGPMGQGPGNLLQTLNQPRPMQNMPMPGMQQQRGMVPQQGMQQMMPQMSGGNMTMGMGGQMGPNQGQMAAMQGGPMQGGPMQGGPMQGGPMQGGPMQGGPMQGGPMQGGPMQGGPMQGGPMQNNPMQMAAQMQLQNQMMGPGGMNQMAIRQGSPNVLNQGPPQMMPNQMQGQPGPGGMQAGMNPGMGGGMAGGQMNPQMMMMNQMNRRPNEVMGGTAVASPLQGMPSPALVPSPNPQMTPGMMGRVQGGPMSNLMAPSPNAPLNTPGQPGGLRSGEAPSPLNAHDEQMYREKYRQLTKYIEPLKKMIAKIGDQDENRLLKLKKLLEILSNPNSRIPLETLLKCETALENQLPGLKDQTINNPLLEAISFNMQSPLAAHTLQRTFRPCLDSLYGPDIRNLPQAPVRKPEDEDEDDDMASHILKREIAGLDHKFKIQLDPTASNHSKTIKLVCVLDDKFLPCVPPLYVTIPEDYPNNPPECHVLEPEYAATEFLQMVQAALTERVASLPRQFSLSHLLDTWEMAVRKACAPKQVAPSSISVLMGV